MIDAIGSDTLAPLVVRWLLHDLATPVATVMTASELLSDMPDPEISELVQLGARRLAGRLKLVRTALVPPEDAMGGAALEKLVREGLEGTAIDWRLGDAGQRAGVVAGAALLLADLRRGQALTIGDGGVFTAAPGPVPERVATVLAGGAPVDNLGAVAAMVASAAAKAGVTLRLTETGIAWA